MESGSLHKFRMCDDRSGLLLVESVEAHSNPIIRISFNANGTLLLSAATDGIIRVCSTKKCLLIEYLSRILAFVGSFCVICIVIARLLLLLEPLQSCIHRFHSADSILIV